MLPINVGTTTMVRCASGMPFEKSSLGKRCGRKVWVMTTLTMATAKPALAKNVNRPNSQTNQLVTLSPFILGRFNIKQTAAVNNTVSNKIEPVYKAKRNGWHMCLNLNESGLWQFSVFFNK